jgi:ATP-dependent DNA ligase
MRRLLNNESVVEYYSLKKEDILSDFSKQKEVFYRIFPRQVVAGEKKPDTLSWMLTRTADGSRQTAPRELIQLLNESRDQQLRNIEIGASDVKGNELFGGVAIKKALDEVSRQRLHQTVYSEYPSLKIYIDKLEGQKAEQTNTTLAKLWKTTSEEVQKISEKLVDVGFFEKRGGGGKVTFWIPFLYRPVLKITQGSAED